MKEYDGEFDLGVFRATVSDLITDFLYYDRKEDDQLPRGMIEDAVKEGKITVDEIVDLFRTHIEQGLGAE